jgi:tetratricopeptide (TPR) repeat protein
LDAANYTLLHLGAIPWLITGVGAVAPRFGSIKLALVATMSQDVLETALAHHQAGRLREAEGLYRQILAANPNDADALQLLGMLTLHLGRPEEALGLIQKALVVNPDAPDCHCNLGLVLNALGRHEQAVAALGQAIKLKPDYVEAYYHLAHALDALSRREQAVAAYRKVLALQPNFAEAANELGVVLAILCKWDDAISAFRQAVQHRKKYVEALNNLGSALMEKGEFQEAVAAFRQSIDAEPQSPAAYKHLGGALLKLGRPAESIENYQQALARQPDSAEILNLLAVAYTANAQLPQAIDACRKALAISPDFADGHNTLGTVLHKIGDLNGAIAEHEKALAIKPGYPPAILNLSLIHLLQGDFEKGWREYEYRWKVIKTFIPDPPFAQMMWDGSDLKGKRILLHPEGGYGDTIQFVRYAPLVAQRGGQVVIGCVSELFRLLQTLDGVAELHLAGPDLPAFDVHCPLLSLPRVLGTTPQTVPANVPYLHADSQLSRRFQMSLPDVGKKLKVGLVWAGRPEFDNDHNRSIALKKLSPLAKIPGVWFCSLQKGEAGQQIRTLGDGFDVVDWTADLHDFADTAAMIDNLDLIISVDTAMAHLSGAMGKRVWVLLPFVPDWRWILNRNDTPWYPTMRLFRQERAGDWETPIAKMADALRELAGSRKSP